MSGRALEVHLVPAHRHVLGAVELHRGIGRLDDLAQRPLRVAELLSLIARHAVDEEVGAHLRDEVLELDVPRMDKRNLEPVHVEVGATPARERPRRAVVIRMNVRDQELSYPTRPKMTHCLKDHLYGVLGVHPAIEEVCLLSVGEEEHVDQAVLERDRQPELENVGGDLAQRQLESHPRHCRGSRVSKMSSSPYSNVLKMEPKA